MPVGVQFDVKLLLFRSTFDQFSMRSVQSVRPCSETGHQRHRFNDGARVGRLQSRISNSELVRKSLDSVVRLRNDVVVTTPRDVEMQRFIRPRLHQQPDDPFSGEPLDGSGFENEIPQEEFSEDPAAAPVTPQKEADRG